MQIYHNLSCDKLEAAKICLYDANNNPSSNIE